jgi:hypothetical protein
MNELQKRNLVAMLQTKRRIAEKREGELVAWFEGLGGQDRSDDLDTQYRLGYNSAVQELADEILSQLERIPAVPGLSAVIAQLAADCAEAKQEFEEAEQAEEDNGFSDALESMARSEAEGRMCALDYALGLVKGIA